MAERKLEIDIHEFPSNSDKSKRKEEQIRLEKVVTGNVRQKKKSLGKQLSETFLEDDARSVGDHLFWDILIPAAKNLVSDMVTNAIDMFFWGGDGGRRDTRTYRDRGKSYVSYSSCYERDRKRDRYSVSASDHRRNRGVRYDFSDIIFDNRRDAEEVLSIMIDHLDQYDEVTVADFYDLAGQDSTYTDRDWGWDNLGSSYVDRVRDGYIIKFPRPIGLK